MYYKCIKQPYDPIANKSPSKLTYKVPISYTYLPSNDHMYQDTGINGLKNECLRDMPDIVPH